MFFLFLEQGKGYTNAMGKIDLLGVNNCRDLAGIKNREGWTLQEGHFLRSNALSHLTHGDKKILKETYHLDTIIDLRTHMEMLRKPDRMIPQVHYEHVSILEQSALGISHEKSILKALDNLPDMRDMYRQMVSDSYSMERFKEVLDIIFQKRSGSVLWHCTEGKDRCGLVSAFVLSILDVSKDEIFKDYERTNEASSMNELKLLFPMALMPKEKSNKIKALFKADRAYLEAAFDEINENYGSMSSYLEVLGFDEKRRKQLQEQYMDKNTKPPKD